MNVSLRKRIYRPPAGDHDPLDDIERALVRALVPIIAEKIRAELAEEDDAAQKPKRPGAN